MGEVKVRFLRLDDKGKLSFTMLDEADDAQRAPPPPKDVASFREVSPDTWLDAVVEARRKYGAFVTVTSPTGVEQQALVPVSKMAEHYVENVDDEVEVGQKVKVRVEGIDDQERPVLSMKLPAGEGDDEGDGDGEDGGA